MRSGQTGGIPPGPGMVKRLEQVAALVVAAGLAIVSYWLFFSWAQGGRVPRAEPRQPAGSPPTLSVPGAGIEAAPPGERKPLP